MSRLISRRAVLILGEINMAPIEKYSLGASWEVCAETRCIELLQEGAGEVQQMSLIGGGRGGGVIVDTTRT